MTHFSEMVIKDGVSIREALETLDRSGEKLLIVCDDDNRILGVLSDGDIRKHILRNGSNTDSISGVYNPSPVCYKENYDKFEIQRKMIELNITCIPITNDDGVLIDVITWNHIFGNTMSAELSQSINIPVVIMAGGKGSRMAPFTDILPKPLIPIGGKPIIEVILEKFIALSATRLFVTINYKKNIIKAFFDYSLHRQFIEFIEEKTYLGTAGSLKLLPKDIDGSILVTNCDVLLDINYDELLRFHNKNKCDITIVGCEQSHTIPYGVLDVCDGLLKSFEEKPQRSYITSTGIYIIRRNMIELIEDDQVMNMTDLLERAIADGYLVGVFTTTSDKWFDVGQWNEYEKSLKEFSLSEYFSE